MLQYSERQSIIPGSKREPASGSVVLDAAMPATQIAVKTGGWLLVVGPHAMAQTLLALTAQLAEAGPVQVLDGGNRFNAYIVSRAARGQRQALNRITVSRAFTCYQVLSLLENTPAMPIPFVVFDLLSTFYDESVAAGERKRLLRTCLAHLERLEQRAGGVVSIHPSKVPSRAAVEMLGMVQEAATDVYFIQPAQPAAEPMRLF